MSYYIMNSKSGHIPNTYFIAVVLALRWHLAFNMDSIVSHAKSNKRTNESLQEYIFILYYIT
jgi:hypothetical protein